MAEDRWYKKGDALLEEIRASRTEDKEALFWFMGQHGFVINLGNAVIYIDVILNDIKDKEGLSKRRYREPFPPSGISRLDYFFCTHKHRDHLNMETLLPAAQANPRARFIVPSPHRGVLTAGGIPAGSVTGAREGGEFSPGGGVTVFPVAAAHPDYAGENGDYECLGYVIRGGGISVYHSGDTYVTPRLVETLMKLRPIDVVILPINGGDWERTAAGIIGNMSALEAVKLSRVLGADLAIPSHYDMMPSNSEDPGVFAHHMYDLCPGRRFHIFALGEQFIYRKGKNCPEEDSNFQNFQLAL
ncbi:MAG: MBL fold metallo-hydrolase [Treponema sp.]|jgi:L-ascorbate metabolism protein UlaG (beta-lactamase superfamily)|nr:MBL fold metallo-hydrolase [Treponema sp.]